MEMYENIRKSDTFPREIQQGKKSKANKKCKERRKGKKKKKRRRRGSSDAICKKRKHK